MCGWAMSQPLPYKDLKWMSYTDINNFDVHYDWYGYFLEVDLIYPYRLHNLHIDLSFCPSNCLASREDKVKKLIADLGNKKNCLIHLSLALRRGYVPKKHDVNWNDAKWIRIFNSKPCKVRRWVPGLQKYYFLKENWAKWSLKKTKITFILLHIIHIKTKRN